MNCKVCGVTSSQNKKISFFRFPKEVKKCKKWAELCCLFPLFERYGPVQFYKSFRICSKHFDSQEMMFDGRKLRLFPTAEPKHFINTQNKLNPKNSSGFDSNALKLTDKLCRLCAETNRKLTHIYGWRGKKFNLEDKLKYFPIKVNRSDSLPLQICHLCIQKLNKYFNFAVSCIKADTKLKEMLNKEMFKTGSQNVNLPNNGELTKNGAEEDILGNEIQNENSLTSSESQPFTPESDFTNNSVTENGFKESAETETQNRNTVDPFPSTIHDSDILESGNIISSEPLVVSDSDLAYHSDTYNRADEELPENETQSGNTVISSPPVIDDPDILESENITIPLEQLPFIQDIVLDTQLDSENVANEEISEDETQNVDMLSLNSFSDIPDSIFPSQLLEDNREIPEDEIVLSPQSPSDNPNIIRDGNVMISAQTERVIPKSLLTSHSLIKNIANSEISQNINMISALSLLQDSQILQDLNITISPEPLLVLPGGILLGESPMENVAKVEISEQETQNENMISTQTPLDNPNILKNENIMISAQSPPVITERLLTSHSLVENIANDEFTGGRTLYTLNENTMGSHFPPVITESLPNNITYPNEIMGTNLCQSYSTASTEETNQTKENVDPVVIALKDFLKFDETKVSNFSGIYSRMPLSDQFTPGTIVQTEMTNESCVNMAKYTCDMCLKNFESIENLNSHFKTHSIESNSNVDLIFEECNKAVSMSMAREYKSREESNASSAKRKFSHLIRTSYKPRIRKPKFKNIKPKCVKGTKTVEIVQPNSEDVRNKRRYAKAKSENDKSKRRRRTSSQIKIAPKCFFCEKSFATPEERDKHQEIHSGDSPYECLNCGKKLRTRRALRQHKTVHSNKRMQVCRNCGLLFTRKDAFRIHLKTHLEPEERPYHCKFCKFSFRRRRCWVKHEKSHKELSNINEANYNIQLEAELIECLSPTTQELTIDIQTMQEVLWGDSTIPLASTCITIPNEYDTTDSFEQAAASQMISF